MPQTYGRTAHERAAIAVHDGYDQLRRPERREVSWRLGHDGMPDRPAATTGEDGDKQNP
jgi:hypothetical protein